MTIVNVRRSSYHMDDSLIKKWDKLRNGNLAKYDEDRFYIVDGSEGSGKSLFTIQQGSYIDPTILNDEKGKILPRICFTSKEFLYAIRNTKSTREQTKVIIFDEAFRGLSSKAALSKDNKILVQALMEARQNNLVCFIVSPSFYLLEFYAAVLRSQALFHIVKEKHSRRRYVRIFGKKDKAILYQIGVRKGWGYPRITKQRVRFFNIYPGGDDFEKKYRKKKRDSLREGEKVEIEISKWRKQRTFAIKSVYNLCNTLKDTQKELEKNGLSLSTAQIARIVKEEY